MDYNLKSNSQEFPESDMNGFFKKRLREAGVL